MREAYHQLPELKPNQINLCVGDYRKGYELITFPAGEPHVKLSGMPEEMPLTVQIAAHISTPDQIFELALVKDALDNYWEGNPRINLFLPYIPFGRQDRVTSKGSAFSLAVFSRFLNDMNFYQVETCDPHSGVSDELINNLELIDYSCPMLNYFIPDLKARNPMVIAPDEGAVGRANDMAEKIGAVDIRNAVKHRNPATGQITGMTIENIPDDRHLLVVDDICDGGGTFIELAKLLPKNRKSLTLFVTHGIFSKGRHVLFNAGYDNVLCAFKFLEEKCSSDKK